MKLRLKILLCRILGAHDAADYYAERLGPSRSGADSGYAGREAGAESGAAEARSGERQRVTPVEAQAAIRDTIKRLETRAAEWDDHASIIERIGMTDQADYMGHSAANDRIAVDFLKTLLPEPESEAGSDLGAPPENPVP